MSKMDLMKNFKVFSSIGNAIKVLDALIIMVRVFAVIFFGVQILSIIMGARKKELKDVIKLG